jgi:hypothetical protein
VDEVMEQFATIPPHMVPEALAVLGEESVESLRERADKDRREWREAVAHIEKAIAFVESLIVYVGDLTKTVKRMGREEPPPPPPPEEGSGQLVQECEECERLAVVFETADDGTVSGWCKRHGHARGLLTVAKPEPVPDTPPTPEAPETAARAPLRSFPMVGGPFDGTRRDLPQGEVSVWLPHGGREYRYDHHSTWYVHSGAPDTVRDG